MTSEQNKGRPAHTPGPWFYDGKSMNTGANIIHVADGEIAEAFSESFPEGQAQANARLISSAPDLLAALEKIVKDAPTDEPEDCGWTGNADDNRDYGNDHMHWWLANIARAAIEKARGP